MDPPPIPLIISKVDMKLNTYYVNIKFLINNTLEKSDMYELKAAFNDNVETSVFLLFQ